MEQREIDAMFEDYWRFSAVRRQRIEQQMAEEWRDIFVLPLKVGAAVVAGLLLGYCVLGLM